MTHGYIVIGIGKNYIDESVLFVNTLRKQNDTRPVSIVVNLNDVEYTETLNKFDKIIPFAAEGNIWDMMKTNFEKYGTYPKIHLHQYAPYSENIYVDTDVICQYNPDKLWEFLSNRDQPITMIGKYDDQSWHNGHIGDISKNIARHIPHVHGGFIYFRKTKYTEAFFNMCELVAFNYEAIGWKKYVFRGDSIADEPLLATSHSYFNVRPLEFEEFPVMTFNYTPDVELPSKLLTPHKKILSDYIPFIHMNERIHHSTIYNMIMEKE